MAHRRVNILVKFLTLIFAFLCWKLSRAVWCFGHPRCHGHQNNGGSWKPNHDLPLAINTNVCYVHCFPVIWLFCMIKSYLLNFSTDAANGIMIIIRKCSRVCCLKRQNHEIWMLYAYCTLLTCIYIDIDMLYCSFDININHDHDHFFSCHVPHNIHHSTRFLHNDLPHFIHWHRFHILTLLSDAWLLLAR